MAQFVLIKTSYLNKQDAENNAMEIIEKKLAACIQISSGQSIYFWEDKIENNKEYFLEIKTKKENIILIEKILSKIHPYKTFEFIVLELDYLNKEYKNWLEHIVK